VVHAAGAPMTALDHAAVGAVEAEAGRSGPGSALSARRDAHRGSVLPLAGVTVATTSTTALDHAVAFLERTLANGPVPATEIRARARTAGISTPTLRRAKDALGLKARKTSAGPWEWTSEGSHPLTREGAQVAAAPDRRPARPDPIVAADSLFATQDQLDRISRVSAKVGLVESMAGYAEVCGRPIGELRTLTSREADRWLAALEKRVER